MSAFNVIALDKNFQIVSLIRFTNLQWNRKYYEMGSFSIGIPLEQYSPDIKYIYTKDRPEMGKVTQRNYAEQLGYSYMQLSGYFLEKELDRHIAYPLSTTNIVSSPAWAFQSGNAEDVAYAYFEGFKEIATSSHSSVLNIAAKGSQSRGNKSTHYRNGESLGYKVHDILKPSEMSYRVEYDFENNVQMFSCWNGIDRTENNVEKNNPIIFSTKYGNIKKPNVLIDENSYKNACIILNEQTNNDTSTFTSRAVFNLAGSDTDIAFAYRDSTSNASDYATSAEFLTALDTEGYNELQNHIKTINVEFDAMEGSYEYMQDFDLGDKCSVEIHKMDLSLDARLIGCYEVMKAGKWTMTMEFGTPIIKK